MVKRVSTDEKLDRIVAFFKTTADLFNIKDLEKRLSKECGISQMLISDLIKRLCDEGLISVEKVGSSNVYWCFPFQKHHFYACETEKIILAIEGYKEEMERMIEQLKKTRNVMANTPERVELLEQYNKLKESVTEIEYKKKEAVECSMEEYKKMENDVREMKNKVNGITENIFTLQGYVTGKFGMEKKEFNKSFGIEGGMDYFD